MKYLAAITLAASLLAPVAAWASQYGNTVGTCATTRDTNVQTLPVPTGPNVIDMVQKGTTVDTRQIVAMPDGSWVWIDTDKVHGWVPRKSLHCNLPDYMGRD